ncbi:MAG: hypothetical protein JWO36_4945 [Myxococcales bacterium]|nr:hypothetical protein [Myxococcales bacterium]
MRIEVMRAFMFVTVAIAASPVDAAPATPEAFEACKARSRALAAEAMKIPDLQERGERLRTMPRCEHGADGTLQVIEPPPPPPVDTTPFAPHLELAARAGMATSLLLSGTLDASGVGPYVEVEAGYRIRRRFGVAAFAGYTNFHDGEIFDAVTRQMYDVREQSYNAGALLNLHYASAFFGFGIGFDYERYGSGFATTAPMFRLHAGYTFAKARGVQAQVLAVLSDVSTPYDLTGSPGSKDDLLCVRLAVGLVL